MKGYTSSLTFPFFFLLVLFLPEPEAPVQNLTANGTGSDTIRISWKPPPVDKMNGFLKEYRVCLSQAQAGSTDMEEVPTSEAVSRQLAWPEGR